MMRLTIYAAATIMASSAAYAQVTTTGATAQSDTQAIAIAGGGGSAGTGYTHESGHIFNTPGIYAPSFANANPCTTPVSAGGAGGPIGLVLGFSPEDEACTRLHDVAAAWQMGMPVVALARWCDGQKNADAYFAATGKPCPGQQNKARYRIAAAPQPAVAAGPPVSAVPVQPTAWRLSPHAQQVLEASR